LTSTLALAAVVSPICVDADLRRLQSLLAPALRLVISNNVIKYAGLSISYIYIRMTH
jgi:hypothetical protein